MCQNEYCEKKDYCIRHTAVPSYRQSYSDFRDVCNKKVGYKFFEENVTLGALGAKDEN